MPNGRRTWARRLAVGAAAAGAVLAALLLWGVAVEPRWLDVRRTTAAVPGLPPAWQGRRVALFADLQLGMWLGNADAGRRAVRRLLADPPAAVLIAGDFLQSADDEVDARVAEAVRVVRPLPDAGIPTYAVLGNHDYGIGRRGDPANARMARQLAAALEAAGVRVLQNDAVALPAPGHPPAGAAGAAGDSPDGPLYLVGLGSNWAGADDPAAAVARVPAGRPYLVLMHNPASFARMADGQAPAAFSGHTHGGQVRLPFTPNWTWLSWVRHDPVHADGWDPPSRHAPGNRLYVTRGIGMSELPVRIHCRPELTLVTLERR